MKDSINFDMEAAINALREGKALSGKDGVITSLIKQLTEAAMQGGCSDLQPNWRKSARSGHSISGLHRLDRAHSRHCTLGPVCTNFGRIAAYGNYKSAIQNY